MRNVTEDEFTSARSPCMCVVKDNKFLGQRFKIMALTSNRNDACKPIFAKANWISLHDSTPPISRPQKKKKKPSFVLPSSKFRTSNENEHY